MEILYVLTDPILPIFAIMAFGYGMGRAGKITIEDARVINRFAMSVLLPVMLFGLLANVPVRRFDPASVAIYAGSEGGVFALGFLLAFGLFKRSAGESVLLAFAGIFANNVFYVLPIVTLLHGEDGVLPITAIVTLDSTVTMGLALIALQIIGLGRVTPVAVVVRLARTPILQAIALGMLFSLAQIPVPRPVQTFIDFNGVAAAPIALFALGVVMSQTRLAMDRVVATFSFIKLILFPAAVWLGLEVLAPLSPGHGQFLLGAAGPAGAMAFSFALNENIRTDTIAQIIIWTSVLSLISLAILA
ncbi:AEC family transporter [Rhodobacteraceae bacterium NNCM2]|nr:AEC family transporter [Coraliihabitans acroporae]